MRMRTRALLWPLFAILLLLVSCGDDSGPTSPDSTQPQQPVAPDGPELTTIAPAAVTANRMFEVVGEPSCCELPGGPYARFGIRFEVSADATLQLTSADGMLTCNEPPEDPDNGMSLSFEDGAMSWTSTVPVGAVVVGNGTRSRVYVYSGRSWGDDGLSAPPDLTTGGPTAVTSVAFCYDYALHVEAAPEASLVKEVQWEISQRGEPSRWDLFPGDRATSSFTVSLEKTGMLESPPSVRGTVTIRNPSPLATTITSATNIISVGMVVPLEFAVTLPHVLDPGDSIEATYERELPDTSTRVNLVSVNTMGNVRGGSARAQIAFGEPTMQFETIHLRASDGSEWGPFTDSATVQFDRAFDTSMLEGAAERSVSHDVSIVESGLQASTTISLRLWEPTFEVDVSTSFTQRWDWQLDVELPTGPVNIAPGVVESLSGIARATAAPGPGDDFSAMGEAVLANPHPARNLELLELDLLVDGQSSALDPIDGSSVEPGAATRVSIHAEVPDGSRTSMRLRAVFQTNDLGSDGSATALGGHEVLTTIDLVFDRPSAEIDACATLRNSGSGELGLVCADQGTSELAFTLNVGPFDACAPAGIDGTIELITRDTSRQIARPYRIEVDVPCEDACTRGAGYWKTHATGYGRHEDPTWEQLPEGPDTPLFESGMSWLDALGGRTWGDPYKRLARAWVAARLNAMAGASTAVIADEMSAAEELLRQNSLGTFSAADRWTSVRLAWRIQAFNGGWIGPGSCDDD